MILQLSLEELREAIVACHIARESGSILETNILTIFCDAIQQEKRRMIKEIKEKETEEILNLLRHIKGLAVQIDYLATREQHMDSLKKIKDCINEFDSMEKSTQEKIRLIEGM